MLSFPQDEEQCIPKKVKNIIKKMLLMTSNLRKSIHNIHIYSRNQNLINGAPQHGHCNFFIVFSSSMILEEGQAMGSNDLLIHTSGSPFMKTTSPLEYVLVGLYVSQK